MKKKIFIILISLITILPMMVKAETLDEIANTIAPDGVMEILAKEPEELNVVNSYVRIAIDEKYEYDKNTNLINVNCTEINSCTLHISSMDPITHTTIEEKDYDITLNYNQVLSDEIYNTASNFASKIQGEKNYKLTDLSLIDWMITRKNSYDVVNLTNYVKELMEIFKGYDEYKAYVDFGAGEKGVLDGISVARTGGVGRIEYNNFSYPLVYLNNFYCIKLPVLYINENTPNTTEAYINAATERIKNSFPDVTLKITYINEYTPLPSEDNSDWSTIEGYKGETIKIFRIEVNGQSENFAIIANDDFVTLPSYAKGDRETGVSIETPIGNIPADTTITVEDLTENKEVIEIVKETIPTEIYKVFDISLYSEMENSNITKLDSGVFKVTIPLGIEYTEKDLVAYYILDNGELEEHDITIDEQGNASFETNHFSRYIIAERVEKMTNNPITGVDVYSYILLSILSLILLIIFIPLKVKNN